MIKTKCHFLPTEIKSFLIISLVGIACGAIVAFILGRIPVYIYTVFPFLIVCVTCYSCYYISKKYNLSSGGLFITACVVASVISFLSFHFWTYLLVVGGDYKIQVFLQNETGSSGFLGFLILKAKLPFNLIIPPIHNIKAGASLVRVVLVLDTN